MGNKLTTCEIPYPNKGKQLKTYLSMDQIHLVQGSWELIRYDLSTLGLIVFIR